MKYMVALGGRDIVIDVTADGVVVDGETITAQLAEIVGTPTYVLALGNKRMTFAVRQDGRGRYTVWTDRHRHEVEAIDERAHAIRQMAPAKGSSAGPSPLVAPMPGLIVRVQVSVGDSVLPGQGLVVMEAMKMENELRAAGAGMVKAVHVTPGTAVEKGAVLVELD